MNARPFALEKLDVDAIRHKKRRKLLLYSLPLTLPVLSIGLILCAISGGAMLGLSMYNSQNFSGAAQTFGLTSLINMIEPYKSPFNTGTALLQNRSYKDAQGRLLQALALAPADKVCQVRVNLSLAYEAEADALRADKKLQEAIERYSRARETIVGDDCSKDQKDSQNTQEKDGNNVKNEQAKQRGSAIQQRLESKSAEAKKEANNESSDKDKSSSSGQDGQSKPSGEKPSDDAVKKLQEQEGKSERARRSRQQSDQEQKDYSLNTDRDYSQPRW
jgi:hypothetical protein